MIFEIPGVVSKYISICKNTFKVLYYWNGRVEHCTKVGTFSDSESIRDLTAK